MRTFAKDFAALLFVILVVAGAIFGKSAYDNFQNDREQCTKIYGHCEFVIQISHT